MKSKTHDLEIQISADQCLYFASDFHLGIPDSKSSRSREKKIVQWLHTVSNDAAAIFLVGDLFDFWFDYQHTIPKGFARFQGKIAELTDRGIPIFIFRGNHDLWMSDYFEEELGVTTFMNPITLQVGSNRIYVGHGDGLGPGNRGFKFIKRIFKSRFFQGAFKWLHPDLGIALASYWSKKSRLWDDKREDTNLGDKESLLIYCKEIEAKKHHDYYIFGHRHLPLQMEVGVQSVYINLGEWISGSSYVEYDGKKAVLKTFAG